MLYVLTFCFLMMRSSIEVDLLKRIKEIEERPFGISSHIADSQIFKWLFEFGRLQDKQESLCKIFRSKFLDDNDIANLLLEYPEYTIAMVAKAKEKEDFFNKMYALREARYRENSEFDKLCESMRFDIVNDKQE